MPDANREVREADAMITEGPTLKATWEIDGTGDVLERIGDGPMIIWHTGNAEIAKALIEERRKMIEKLYASTVNALLGL